MYCEAWTENRRGAGAQPPTPARKVEDTPIEIKEKELLDLLEECLPVLHFAEGGFPVEGLMAKIKMVLKLAGRQTDGD